MKDELTHKGWFGICPVYVGGLDGPAPLVVERHWVFVPLMVVSELCFSMVFTVCGAINPDFEAQWPLTITGEIKPKGRAAE